MAVKNLLRIPPEAAADLPEYFEGLLSGRNGLRVERIISHGHVTPDGEWYDQDEDEWVLILKGEAAIQYVEGQEVRLSEGDCLFFPKHVRHRVSYSSCPCIWLAVFSH